MTLSWFLRIFPPLLTLAGGTSAARLEQGAAPAMWQRTVTWGDWTQRVSWDMVWGVYVAMSFCTSGAGGRRKQLVALQGKSLFWSVAGFF